MFVEVDARREADYTVSLEGNRDTSETQIVAADAEPARLLVFLVTAEDRASILIRPGPRAKETP